MNASGLGVRCLLAVVPQSGNKANHEEEKHGKAGGNAPDATLFSPGAPSKTVDQEPDGKARHQHARQHVKGDDVDGIAGEIDIHGCSHYSTTPKTATHGNASPHEAGKW